MTNDKKKKIGELAKKVKEAKPTKGTAQGAPSPSKPAVFEYPYPVLKELFTQIKDRLPPWERVIIDWNDDKHEITIKVEVKEGFEHRRADKSPLIKKLKFPYTAILVTGVKVPVTWRDIQLYPVLQDRLVVETIRDVIIRDTVNEVVDNYFLVYVHPAFVFNPAYLVYRFEGDKKAYIVVANLAKEGSPWHASVLYTKISNRLNMWADTKSDVEHFVAVDGISEWGFPNLHAFLATFPTYEYRAKREVAVILDWLKEGVKETLEQYARVVESPDLLTDEDIKKTYEVADKVAKTVPMRILRTPPQFNEAPIVEVLEQLMMRYPHLKPKILPVIQQYSTEVAVGEYEEERKVAKAEQIAHEVVEALKEKQVIKETKTDAELVEELKKRILKRLEEL